MRLAFMTYFTVDNETDEGYLSASCVYMYVNF